MDINTDTMSCEKIESAVFFESSAGEKARLEAAAFGVAPEHVLFAPGDLSDEDDPGDERRADAWEVFRLRAFDH